MLVRTEDTVRETLFDRLQVSVPRVALLRPPPPLVPLGLRRPWRPAHVLGLEKVLESAVQCSV